MTDEPAAPPVDHTIDAMRYMMARLHKPQPAILPPTIVTPEFAKDLYQWRNEFNLTDEQMKSFGVDFGTEVAAVMVTWTPDGPRYKPIAIGEFYDNNSSGGNIGGNGSEDT